MRALGVDLDLHAARARACAHPYEPELQGLAYADWMLRANDPPRRPRALAETPLTWVDTPEALAALAAHLARETEVAVDLENHAFRSFQGFCCLMQVSTRSEDFLVDALALRDRLGAALGPCFADPGVVKVLHGSDNDVLWLQRDFGLYLVNLFDTGQAARALGYESFSLAYLLKKHCGVVADKRYQLADWRVPAKPPNFHSM